MQKVYLVEMKEGEGSDAIGGFYASGMQLEFSKWENETTAVYLAIVEDWAAAAFEQACNTHPDVISFDEQSDTEQKTMRNSTTRNEQTLKSITLSIKTVDYDTDTSTAFTKTFFEVVIREVIDVAVETFDTRDEAEAYMAEVSTRSLKPMSFGSLLSERR